MPSTHRSRPAVAAVLIACAAVFIAVTLSQWLFGAGVDPRDDYGSRAAGIGFADVARQTLFSIVPVAAPAAAAWLHPGRVIRRLAQVVYGCYIVTGVLLALSAAMYGYDTATQLASQGEVWIDSRTATERLLLDGVWLVLAVVGVVFVRWSRTREQFSILLMDDSASPKE
ncbi:hypothetical protein [Glycomyces tenuis]|uniref:hypothetical protein n=1 Tax=Glycomyces tenuis TaxID=58116 RepID=UPI0003F9DEFA|nr:hypothetical protein [Glycomyces tenuis]